jgi:hypothetical protein
MSGPIGIRLDLYHHVWMQQFGLIGMGDKSSLRQEPPAA